MNWKGYLIFRWKEYYIVGRVMEVVFDTEYVNTIKECLHNTFTGNKMSGNANFKILYFSKIPPKNMGRELKMIENNVIGTDLDQTFLDNLKEQIVAEVNKKTEGVIDAEYEKLEYKE